MWPPLLQGGAAVTVLQQRILCGSLVLGLSYIAGCRFVRQQVCEGNGKGIDLLAVVPLSSPGGDWEDGMEDRAALGTLSPSSRERQHIPMAPSMCSTHHPRCLVLPSWDVLALGVCDAWGAAAAAEDGHGTGLLWMCRALGESLLFPK